MAQATIMHFKSAKIKIEHRIWSAVILSLEWQRVSAVMHQAQRAPLWRNAADRFDRWLSEATTCSLALQ